MKKCKCSRCGKEFQENIKYCPACGSPTERMKNGNPAKWIFIGVIITLAACAIAFFAFFYEPDKDKTPEQSKPAAQKETTAVQKPAKEKETEETYSDSYQNNLDYILPNSNTKYLSYADIADLTTDELRFARNEIYARKGRMFDSDKIRAYFQSKDWYYGEIPPDEFTEDMLSDIEKANVELLLKEENARTGE